MSRAVCSIRWAWPRCTGTPGSVTSMRSSRSRRSSSASRRSPCRVARAPAPASRRASFSVLPRVPRAPPGQRAELAQRQRQRRPAGRTGGPADPPAPRCRPRRRSSRPSRVRCLDVHGRPSLLTCPRATAYDGLGPPYDAWCRSVVEDIACYVDLAIASRRSRCSRSVSASGRVAVPTAARRRRGGRRGQLARHARAGGRRAEPQGVALDLRPGGHARPARPGRDSRWSRCRSGRSCTSPTTSALAVLRSLRGAGWRRAARWPSTSSIPHPLDIAETHDRWMEREPGIHERARWDASDSALELTRARTDGCEADDAAVVGAAGTTGGGC